MTKPHGTVQPQGKSPLQKQRFRASANRKRTPADKLSARLGYTFHDETLLETALTHGSFFHDQAADRDTSEIAARKDNERLEFLGDAVLGLVAAETLYERFPYANEGVLTQMRAHLVSRKHLGKIGQRLHMGSALRLGRGEEQQGGRSKAVLMANALEALAGAMFLDSGLDAVRELFTVQIAAADLKTFASAVDEGKSLADAKSALQEYLQAGEGVRAEYILLREAGPDHDKSFTMQAVATIEGRRRHAKATAKTKKLAEQEAARKLLARLMQSASQP